MFLSVLHGTCSQRFAAHHSVGRHETIGYRHLKEWSQKPSLRQPVIPLEAAHQTPQDCTLGPGPPTRPSPVIPARGPGSKAGEVLRCGQARLGRTIPCFCRTRSDPTQQRIPGQCTLPFSEKEFSFPVKS